MKKNNKVLAYLTLLITAALMAACSLSDPAEDENNTGMANPAAVYCTGLGYTLESVERDGGEDANCVFPDGSRCPQWDFLYGECGQEYSYCEQQGGVIEENGDVHVCRFADGSYCDEYSFFTGKCAAGDNFDETTGYPIKDGTAAGNPIEDDAESGYPIEITIQNFEEARDYMAVYFANEYGVEVTEAWVESDTTIDEATASTTIRYVSGSVTLVISSMASAPAVNYTIDEASDLTNGFYWQGTLSSDGTVIVESVNLPGTVLNVEDAREAALAYVVETFSLPTFGDWVDEGSSQGDIEDRPTTIRTYTSGAWTVEVEFEPAAPLVSLYMVRVVNSSNSFSWEGEITIRGEITESWSTQ